MYAVVKILGLPSRTVQIYLTRLSGWCASDSAAKTLKPFVWSWMNEVPRGKEEYFGLVCCIDDSYSAAFKDPDLIRNANR